MKWFSAQADALKKFSDEQLVNLNLFDGEAFFGRLLCFRRGQVVPYHRHEHTDECFDVIEGEGTFLIDGREMRGTPGMTLYVPANIEHGLRADGSEQWVVRETVSERVYAGRAAKMVVRAALKRLPLIGARFKSG
ncbi:MAG: cupin domain-containing protein [Chloroflexota bacterium]|nr:cupin domain-containing protein [Chloroflexota bacterium]